ncbi:MAG: sigma-70 family RNA polymerase sigma factor [Phycisphaerae bacterium]|nr:sigma-70 family RNA polymerase sigma factor [Phycisphaerae bacterium]
MPETRATLLMRIKDPRDEVAWREFHALYAPLLYRYACARGLLPADAEEVRDQCLEVLTRSMPGFEYDRGKGRFKSWLRRIVNNKVSNLLRDRRERIAQSREVLAVPDPHPSPDELWEEQWRYQHLKHCVEQVKGLISEKNYRAFSMLLFDGCSVAQVCAELEMNPNQVYVAKSRALQRVRQKLAELGFELE